MTHSIADALQQAQQALNGGDYRSAAATCSQLVAQFPGYAAAWRLLGEAYREQGLIPDAERAYAAALSRDPRHASAYLGLGLVAEDQGSVETALAFCQVAWELAPNQVAVREPLTRIAMRRYGADGDLQLTRAGLAQLHASTSRVRRAIDEYRAALAELPGRVDLRLGLAESLWRLGEDDEAARICREIIERHPDAAPALVMLADVERRKGNTRRADEHLKRLRAVDPDGAVAAGMIALNPRAERSFLEIPAGAIPFLIAAIVAAPVERARSNAAAPDFEYRPTRVDVPTPDIDDLQPISLEEFGAVSHELPAEDPYIPINLEELSGLPEGLQPMSIEEFGGEPGELPGERPGARSLSAFSSFGFEDFSAPDAAGIDLPLVEPTAPAVAPPAEPAPWTEPAAPVVDDISSLAAALQVDVAGAITRAGETPVDEVDANRPPEATPRGYTTMLRSLNDEGFAPFDPRARAAAAGMSMTPEGEPAAGQPGTDELGTITRDWDTIDDEIQRAMPAATARGYTDELRALDEIGITPFEVEDGGDDLAGVTPFSPFEAEPALRLQPQPPPPPPQDYALDAGSPAPAEGAEADPEMDVLLGGLQPFSFEEFDRPRAAGGGSIFSQSWDAAQGASAIPSDEDLDALLALGEDDEPEEDALVTPPADAVVGPAQPAESSEQEESLETLFAVDAAVLQGAGLGPHADRYPAAANGTPPVEDVERWQAASATEQPPAMDDVDLLRSIPGLDAADMNALLGNSVAVTRALSVDPTQRFAADPALDDLPPLSENYDAPLLRPGTEMFTRAREVKRGLMSEGLIGGERELERGMSTDELVALEDAVETRRLQSEPLATHHDHHHQNGSLANVGATRDTTTLRAALEVTPDDDELHWWLAEALRARGDMDEAWNEYRWLIRNAPNRHDAVIEALSECVERAHAPEMAHRLLGDIYRRRGDVSRASSHAAMALQVRRRGGRLR